MYNLPEPKFKELELSTKKLQAACQRGMEAARLFSKAYRLQLVEKPVKVKRIKKKT
jgi:hypothetical protein